MRAVIFTRGVAYIVSVGAVPAAISDELMILPIHERLATRFNDRITVIDLFSYPSIAALAKYLEQSQNDAPLELAAEERADRQLQAFAAVKGGRNEAE